MTCYHPLKGWRAREQNSSGKRSIVFDRKRGWPDRPVTLPCGQCIGCRLERSRQWAIRCVHEASLHENNCFITLTYNDENLPKDGSLNIRHFQLFMKRLRFKYGPEIRFFHCGEYGKKLGRPHYHAIIFNHQFKDQKLWKVQRENRLYISSELQTLWTNGFSSIGAVTFQSAAYVARYILKKVTGEPAENHYEWVDSDGVIHDRAPEYVTMSRRPGIAKGWVDKYMTDVYPDDFIIIAGKKMRPPRYYNGQYEILDKNKYRALRARRIVASKKNHANNTTDRLLVRETVQKARLARLTRELE